MQPNRNCFSKGKKFVQFNQGENIARLLDPPADPPVYRHQRLGPDLKVPDAKDAGDVKAPPPEARGLCFGFCCNWIDGMKRSKRYNAANIGATHNIALQRQRRVNERHQYSGHLNALHMTFIMDTVLYHREVDMRGQAHLKRALDAYGTEQGANFLIVIMHIPEGQHAIVAKLNQSYTGGWLNWSHPCALFDPNVGHAFYGSHDDLATDILRICNAYRAARVYAFTICCKKID